MSRNGSLAQKLPCWPLLVASREWREQTSVPCLECPGGSLSHMLGRLSGLQQGHMKAWDPVTQKCWIHLGWSLCEVLLLQVHAGILAVLHSALKL